MMSRVEAEPIFSTDISTPLRPVRAHDIGLRRANHCGHAATSADEDHDAVDHLDRQIY